MNSDGELVPSKHIRPKATRSRQPSIQLDESSRPISEHDRPTSFAGASPPKQPPRNQLAAAATATNPSILRRSKYSTPSSAPATAAAIVTPENESAATAFGNGDDGVATETETIMKKSPNSDSDSLLAVQDFVVEKRRRKKETTNSITQQPANSTSTKTTAGTDPKLSTTGDVEGYVPRTTGTYSMKVSTSSSTAPNLADTKTVKGGMERPATSDNNMSDDEDNDKPKNSGDDGDEDDDPLVFNSLSDLMAMAGTLPNPEDKSNSPVMIEAELQFSCMDQDEFQQEQQQVFYRKQNIFDDDHDNNDSDESTSPRSDDDDGNEDDDEEDDLWDVLGLGGSMDGEDEEEPARPPRAFLQLWTALSQWVTPEAAEFVAALQAFEKDQYVDNESTTGSTASTPAKAFVAPKASPIHREQSDVALSRCAGLMAALRLHTARCWHLLNIGRSNELRTVEMTLADLLRCFDYSRPMPPMLDLALTRALACVLLHTVSPVVGVSLLAGEKGTAMTTTTTVQLLVPKPCAVLGMTADEYTYLVRSAIVTFGKTSMDDDSQQ